mgnify:CR=1 FL=1
MCGLFGALSFTSQGIDKGLAQAMSEKVARRGPDDKGEWFDGPVMLGHRRLSIIDLSSAGHQPMHDVQQRYSIVFNGTIYNYPELREQLLIMGYQFQSNSDTEVCLNAYSCWCQQCSETLTGMFAFATLSPLRQRLFLSRHRSGCKPH